MSEPSSQFSYRCLTFGLQFESFSVCKKLKLVFQKPLVVVCRSHCEEKMSSWKEKFKIQYLKSTVFVQYVILCREILTIEISSILLVHSFYDVTVGDSFILCFDTLPMYFCDYFHIAVLNTII